ncbi:MAG: tRNA (guanosine(46)-N7)-methyltransferase TrmB [Clostridia bacterium]|nr:tRNA (guanosine(46)-N7)-methyltransferase TrmB [Clostridia bacterium]
MRMRKKKHGEERIQACAELLIEDPSTLIADPASPFSDKSKGLCLEIGCGKGNFAVGTAKARPHENLIAMEKVPDVCCIALEKAMACRDERPDNLRFIIGNADNLSEWFPEHCLDRIYLNFSDPWPKAGHAKRRLTHRIFLERYKRILKEDGRLIFKTDNVGLFDFSLESFEEFGCTVEWMTRDLHNSERAADNVMTEYEKNWSEKGFTINSAIVRFN